MSTIQRPALYKTKTPHSKDMCSTWFGDDAIHFAPAVGWPNQCATSMQLSWRHSHKTWLKTALWTAFYERNKLTLSLWSAWKPALEQPPTFKKQVILMSSKSEPTIWSYDTGQQTPYFHRCQLTITWMCNIKDVCCTLQLYVLLKLLAGVWSPCCPRANLQLAMTR